MLKEGGGGAKRFDEVLTQELEVLAILKGARTFHHLKGGGREMFYLVLRGSAKSFEPAIFPFCRPPPSPPPHPRK